MWIWKNTLDEKIKITNLNQSRNPPPQKKHKNKGMANTDPEYTKGRMKFNLEWKCIKYRRCWPVYPRPLGSSFGCPDTSAGWPHGPSGRTQRTGVRAYFWRKREEFRWDN